MMEKHDKIQQNVITHMWNNHPNTRRCIWHTPNEFKNDNHWLLAELKGLLTKGQIEQLASKMKFRAMTAGARRKSIGVLRGVVDILFYWKGTLHMLDVKVGTDKLSEDQKKFIEAIEKEGGKFYEVESTEQAIEILEGIISNS